jgi:uncharacterized surface protein with fasciclin (FAS1) repeats
MKQPFFLMGFLFLSLSFVLTTTGCDNNDDDAPQPDPTVFEFVQNNSDFDILRSALERTGLDALLNTGGPFTVFAPDDDAFQAFLTNAGIASINDIPVDVLTQVLTYHVIGGEFRSTNLVTGYVSTASATKFGSDIYADLYVNIDNGVVLNGSVNVDQADVVVENGVIHVVDQVIALPNVVTFAVSNPNFSILVQALTRTDLTTDFVSVLSGEGPFTVFAPTNAAFQALLNSNPTWNSLNDIPADVLEKVLLYHVTAAGNVRSTDLTDGQVVPTLASGETFTIDLTGPTPRINAGSNSANIIATDVQSTNGVIHAIDTVILPE